MGRPVRLHAVKDTMDQGQSASERQKSICPGANSLLNFNDELITMEGLQASGNQWDT